MCSGAHGAYAVSLEWCPGSAALLTCAILRIDLATLGWPAHTVRTKIAAEWNRILRRALSSCGG